MKQNRSAVSNCIYECFLTFLKTTVLTVFYYFFPERCIICCREISFDNKVKICRKCIDKIPEKRTYSAACSDFCRLCSRKLISETDICTVCRNRSFIFIKNTSLWQYNNTAVKRLIHNYKFKNYKSAAVFLSNEIRYFYNENYSGYAVIPVPCSRKRIVNNGWDHMKIISDRIRSEKIPVFNILKRKHSKEQKKLSSDQRLSNLEKRFYIKRNFNPEKLENYKVF